jgi:hypothetical protein
MPTRTAMRCGNVDLRHCERSKAIQNVSTEKVWIASSRSLSSGAHSRDPLAPRNDGALPRHALLDGVIVLSAEIRDL